MFSLFMMGLMTVEAAPQEYTLNSKGSNLYVTVYKDNSTLLSAAAHNHAIRATNLTSSIKWDAEDLTACAINISVNVADLEVDSEQSRSLAASKEKDAKIRKGFEKSISDSDRKAVRKNMLSAKQLDGETHKTIDFKSTSCTDKSVTGDFTLHGVTKSITMPARITVDNEKATKFSMSGSFPISSTEYGFEPYSDLGGAVKNQDKMTIHVRIKAE